MTVPETKLLQHFFSLILKGPKAEADFTSPKEEVLNYFDKIHPVVSTMTRSPSLIACPPAHTHAEAVTHTAYTHCHKEEDHLSLWSSP